MTVWWLLLFLLLPLLYIAYRVGRTDFKHTLEFEKRYGREHLEQARRLQERLTAEYAARELLVSEALQTEAELQLETVRREKLEAEIRKLTSQKKSSEVRTGLIAEQMAPFLDGFPYDPKTALFLGRPVDFLVFDDTGVHFVEVKSGESRLSPAQRRVKQQIDEGLVTFEVYRIKGD